jgi:hypothetical protein
LCLVNAVWNTTGVTVAGHVNGSPSGSLAGLRYPNDIYVFPNGTLLIADYGNDRIIRWEVNSTQGVLIAGTGVYGSWHTLLARPAALAGIELLDIFIVIDSMFACCFRFLQVRFNELYVSDVDNYRIQVCNNENLCHY